MNLVTISHLEHTGGTKDYTLIMLHKDNQQGGVIMKRWGKIGSSGQSGIDNFSIIPAEAFRAELSKREKRGYKPGRQWNDYDSIESLKAHWERHSWFDSFASVLKTWLSGQGAGDPIPSAEKWPEAEVERGEIWGSW